jgi:predicted metal-dependent HD superfamily phosphohydrolase
MEQKAGVKMMILEVWNELLSDDDVPAADALAGLQRILSGYSGRGRHYHNLVHLEALLGWVDRLEDQLTDPVALRWAILYHDIIYKSRRKDNETASAAVARKEMSRFGLQEDLISRVEDMINRTQHHDGEGADADTRLMLDMDLSILGTTPEIYQEYTAQVRREYRWVPAILYRKGRAAVLKSFLERDRIYFSDYFYNNFEAAARQNLQRELDRLLK